MRIDLPPAFVDARGSIQNIIELLANERPIRGAAIIRSVAGSERSNHWHREDGHYLYVLEGEMHYWESSVEVTEEKSKGPPIIRPRESDERYRGEPGVFKAGECVFTGPRLWHRTYFPVDTTLLSLSFLPRDAASHESDVVR